VELAPGRKDEIKNHGELRIQRPRVQMGFDAPRLWLRSFISELLMGLRKRPAHHHEISHEAKRHELAAGWPRVRSEERRRGI
jgi:hypothetical protein